MARLRREALDVFLFLAAALLVCCARSVQAAEWLPWWMPAPVRQLLAATTNSLAAQASCPPDLQTCPNGLTVHRQPELNCQFPDCPDEAWKVQCDPNCNGVNTCAEHCSGSEEQNIVCPNAVVCATAPSSAHSCSPVNCELNQWTEWAVQGCTGLCNRTRTFNQNACGGAPCVGRLHETMWCASPCNPSVDCLFAEWSSWGTCDGMSMKHRSRSIAVYASGDGSTCEGALESSQSCVPTFKSRVDCVMSAWMAWSGCTATCGGGEARRLRGVQLQAKYGGSPCALADLMQLRPCATTPCSIDTSQAVDCQIGVWAEWSVCTWAHRLNGQIRSQWAHGHDSFQRSRSRAIASPSKSGGKACRASLEEIAPCSGLASQAKPKDCAFSAWSAWGICSKTCDGGQAYRQRRIVADAENGGAVCQDSLMETRVCNAHTSCAGGQLSGNCALSPWLTWSGCTATCGQGLETRERVVTSEAAQGGRGCANPVNEIRGCTHSPACANQDCLWADWTIWASCTRTCGKGTRSRTRTVQLEPKGTGKACDPLESTLELTMCNTQHCEKVCVDGSWGLWTPWSTCTRRCGGGAQWRRRQVTTEANSCGNPANGSSSEFRACSTNPCEGDANCELSLWTKWSACSKSCGGAQVRERSISVDSSGAGRPCQDALVHLRSCDGLSSQACGTETMDCQMETWSVWSRCSVTCEGGQRTRTRIVAVLAMNGGKPCSNSLEETSGCSIATKCNANAKDCAYSEWSQWGACAQCDGERVRTREIIQFPENGVACDRGSTKEVGMCQRHCNGKVLYYCAWDKWTSGPCSKTCGTSSRTQIRHMIKTTVRPDTAELVGKLHVDWETCSGSQVSHEACDVPKCVGGCVPQDCMFNEWSAWHQPTGNDCNGLCSRNRSVFVHSNKCGKSCVGATRITKPCINAACGKQDCAFGSWGAWNSTVCHGKEGQKYRLRSVIANGLHGGDACAGSLKQVASCDIDIKDPVACLLSAWSNWAACDKTCGFGKRYRERAVQIPAVDGGQPCSGSLRKVQGCNTGDCPIVKVDCALSSWSMWFGCRNQVDDQAYRTRLISTASVGVGKACVGSLKETGACAAPTPVDCSLSNWGAWGLCDASCGGGQKFRTREVAAHAQNGGAPCANDLHRTYPCNTDPCPSTTNCAVSDWAAWSACSPKCGQGVTTRTRKITQWPADGAAGCALDLKAARSCKSASCAGVQDCKLGAWAEWSACRKASGCGVGYRERERLVAQGAGVGGHPCHTALMKEAQAHEHCPGGCHEHCVNGAWEQWQEWSTCTVSCGTDGNRFRTRKALAASHCGFPAEGPDTEYSACSSTATCPGGKDCTWTAWSTWKECSGSCGGSKSRSREVANHAELGGRPCHGGVLEVGRCNPADGESTPPACPNAGASVDCVLSPWGVWSSCSRPCEGGYQTRHRTVVTQPQNAGLSCDKTLREISSCNNQRCKMMGQQCVFAAWQEWSACGYGSRLRSRAIAVKPVYGADCQGPTEEVSKCESDCEASVSHFCVWSLWSLWSGCSTTCGPTGRMTRQRKLVATRELAK